MGQVAPWLSCDGLALDVGVPRPPPSCPTITIDVGIEFVPKVRLLVRLIVRSVPVGTVITTGDHPPPAFGLRALQPTVVPAGCIVSQLYPHIGTEVPSGSLADVGAAVKFTCCVEADPTPRRRT